MTLGHKLWNLCGKFWVYAYHQSFVTASPHSFHIPMSMGDPLLLDFHHLMVMKLGDWCCPWLFVCGSCLIRHFCTSLYLNAFASGVKTLSKICACCWVIIAYFRLARKNSVLHPCLTVQCCQYFHQSLPSACVSIFSVWFSGTLWMVEKDFKVLLDVSGCLHNAGTYLHLYIPVWVIPWVVEEHDRPGWKQVSGFD